MEECAGDHHASGESSGNIENAAVESFTAEEEALYSTRYIERYNAHT